MFSNSLSPSGPSSAHLGREAGPVLWPGDGISKLPTESISQAVDFRPADAVRRRAHNWHGMGAEVVELTPLGRIECSFRGPVHLLVVHEQGTRREGETFVEGLPPSALRDLSHKLTFVPAGHEYRGWQEPRTLTRLMNVFFNPEGLPILSGKDAGEVALPPRLHFESTTLWETSLKLKRSLEASTVDELYVEALGNVLMHELLRFSGGAPRRDAQARGGLAPWQRNAVTTYVEQHLAERISLATLAQLARLSPYYFCRAFKRSFGMSPLRYHSDRRMERAKALLAERIISVTDIGRAIGFSETSSFSAAFRRATGLTPSSYHRTLY